VSLSGDCLSEQHFVLCTRCEVTNYMSRDNAAGVSIKEAQRVVFYSACNYVVSMLFSA